jgi:hypothetical protein
MDNLKLTKLKDEVINSLYENNFDADDLICIYQTIQFQAQERGVILRDLEYTFK